MEKLFMDLTDKGRADYYCEENLQLREKLRMRSAQIGDLKNKLIKAQQEITIFQKFLIDYKITYQFLQYTKPTETIIKNIKE